MNVEALTNRARTYLSDLVPFTASQERAKELALSEGTFRAMRSVYMELAGEAAEISAGADRHARNAARKKAQERLWAGAGSRPCAGQVVTGSAPCTAAVQGSRLYVYRIIHEVGFAPNITGGVLTLTTCKPVIRRGANVGDYVLGLLPKMFGYAPAFVAKVTDKFPMASYWSDPKWAFKKPHTDSVEGLYGDNAYEFLPDGTVKQHPCSHSLPRWTTNEDAKHTAKDTSGLSVLVSDSFYFGGEDRPLLMNDDNLLFSILGANENIRGHRIFPGEVGEEMVHAIERSL